MQRQTSIMYVNFPQLAVQKVPPAIRKTVSARKKQSRDAEYGEYAFEVEFNSDGVNLKFKPPGFFSESPMSAE